MNDVVDQDKRKFLRRVAALAGVVGVAGFVSPFVASMFPSRKAMDAMGPVRVDISQLKPGQLNQVLWQGKPVTILHRTDKQLADLKSNTQDLVDAKSLQSKQPEDIHLDFRSHKGDYERYLVVLSVCTHLGCVPNYNPDGQTDYFLCPCHQSSFDLAGRVFKGKPANLNLEIPPHCFDPKTGELVIGLNQLEV
ncbi:MAG: ubiquinol-cytochrome c reductase iron-sulfur subunit [Candidatus Comchoanobacterales bacterium]